uniref:RB1-inducible coiled-coil protein 1-like n=2 Tax=Sinocyclocheilus anshuiensis TaxID=1608454 RepID=A0A671N070_9TELE
MDPVLQQGSLDLDSLAESPESDFMSAVNEFVIEENLMSPNPISDPTSPEMMVESLYSSVINAIDSKRIQDTTTLEKENSKIAVLKLSADRYRSAAEESQNNLRKVKEDLYHFRGLVLKEQRDFGFALKTMTIEVRNTLNSVRYCHEEELRETQQTNLQSLKDDHEKQMQTLLEELEGNQKIVRDIQRAMLELEGLVERKEKEISQLESERERSMQELQDLHKQTVQDLEEKILKQSEELKATLLSKDELAGQLENLHFEIEHGQQKIRQEMEKAEKVHLQELETWLKQQHEAELESLRLEKKSALDKLVQENLVKLRDLMDSHSLDPRMIQPFLTECRETITKLDNQNMKAIKGLEDRLYALDQMIASCKRLVNEQQELAQGFLANQKRAENLKDTSVLPDLCLSHANQLMIMLTNHRKLLDIKQKCTTAKQELANNLQVRLKWCCYVMLHADQDGEKLQALLRLLTELLERVRVVEALSTVPQMYCLAVVEVVRRRMFIGHYRQWASALVKDGKNLYEAEKVKRETFGKLFRKSFLRNRLFRGLDSWPPSSFCTRKPRKFDFELPDISLSDLQYLKSCCPSEVQPYLRVPTLCDFEPLNQHVEVLHQLVQAAQSVDEMSKTITHLLNEQKISFSQSAQRSTALTPRSESTTEITSTSTKTLSTLSLKAPDCQPLALPGPLEDLSPDSIDAQTFDFETIGHPNMDPVLQQGSLDLDSLAESPESDFMSAVNEFVIEENLMSPNPISDPTSPEMMVESLYSSVINAIDSKRIKDTTTLEKENSKIAALKLSADRYRSAAEESQNNLRKVKEDLYHFRGLVLKEQRDFGFALKTMTIEVRNALNSVRYCHEEELRETQQTNLQSLKDDHEKQMQTLLEELEGNQKIVRDIQRAMLELEGLVERKEKEISQLESERARSMQELQDLHMQTLLDLEQKLLKQSEELKAALLSKDEVAGQLEKLHFEIEHSQQKIRQDMEKAEKVHLQELETWLKQQHEAELESLRLEKKSALDKLVQENLVKLRDLMDSHSAELKDREGRLKDLEARITELADARCKLEVEMALKEAEMEDMRLQYEEAKSTQEEVLKAELTTQTTTLQTQIDMLNKQLQQKNEEYEVGLAELRALMRLEKDHCISELVDRHEEESTLLRQEFSALKQKSQDAEKDCEKRVQKIQHDHQNQLDALQREKEYEQRAFQEKERELSTVIGDLQAENTLLSGRLEQERVEALQRAEKEKEQAVKAALQEALRDFQLQKEETETRLLGQIELLENQEAIVKTGLETSTALSLDSGQWTEERASLLAQLELLERTKNEEMQNLKTSLIAEQQTNFNTVVTREKLKKEQIINDLTEKLKNLTQQQEKDKGLIETLSEDRASILQEKKQMEEELNRLRSTVLVSSSFFPPNPIPVFTEAHGACGPTHAEALSPSTPDPERLASTAAFKDEERVESAVEASMMTMSQSMSSVSSRHSEKIAIRDFQVGDLVLIILDERHDNYVLFTVGPTLYFLHSESLTALDLKPATGATRRPWVLGKVMEKEYCQAKKAQNRFKVPLGTKFYRVKAVPWNKKV